MAEKRTSAEFPVEAEDDPVLMRFRALAALGAILGTVGAVVLPFSILRLHDGSFAGSYKTDYYYGDACRLFADTVWLPASGAIGAGLSVALVIGSVGALGLRWWGRVVLLLWAPLTLLIALPATIFYVWWLFPPWRNETATVRQTVESLASIGAWAIGIPLATAVLIELLRPAVKAHFAANEEEPE